MPMKPRTKRLIARLIVCTLGGAVITAVVACGCALWMPMTVRLNAFRTRNVFEQFPTSTETDLVLLASGLAAWSKPIVVPQNSGQAAFEQSGATPLFDHLEQRARQGFGAGFIPDLQSMETEDMQTTIGMGVTADTLAIRITNVQRGNPRVSRSRSGLPMRCFEGNEFRSLAIRTDHPPVSPRNAAQRPAWLAQSSDSKGLHVIPYGVLWPGFLLDTAVYGTLVGALMWGPGYAIRALRRRRQQCEMCGYDRRGLASAAAVCPECGKPDNRAPRAAAT